MKKLIFFILAICLSACTTYQTVDIEILSSSSYIINPRLNDVIIINNAYEQDSSVGHKTYKNKASAHNTYSRSKKVSKDTLRIDSTTKTAVHEMYKLLVESNIFESVEIGHESPKSISTGDTILELIYKNPNVVIIRLESLDYADHLSYYYRRNDTVLSELGTQIDSQWLVYQYENLARPYRFSTSETLFWSLNDTDRVDCILDAVESNTKLASGKIIPQWETESRLYYKGKNSIYCEIDEAIETANWEQTGVLWMSLYNSENKDTKQKARMAYNMALFFEMRNDLETALIWIETATRIFTEKKARDELAMCSIYAKTLKYCVLNKKKLDLQYNY